MKLSELKNRFRNKFFIQVLSGVLVVVLAGTAVGYNVYAAKNTKQAETAGEREAGDAESETENDLEETLSHSLADSINVEEKEVDKDETVYVIADNTGKASSTIVSAWLKNPKGERVLKDASDLKDITNVKGEESFTQDGNKLTWQAEGKDIYYQGTTAKEAPVTEKITYYLDDKEMSPSEIAGKSGKVKIRFDYENHESVKADIGGEQQEIHVPFIVVSGMALDDKFTNVKVTNGKVISNGAGNMVVGFAMPGLKESLDVEDQDFSDDISIPDYVEVTADVEDFSLDMTMSIVTSGSDFKMDGALDFSELDGKVEDLTDATNQLMDGSDELAEGLDTLNGRMPEFSNGLNDLQSGVKSYTDGAKTLADGISTLKNSSGELISGVGQLRSSVRTLNDGVKTLNQAVGTGMSDEEKAKARSAAEAQVEAQFGDDSNPQSYNNIKSQAAETFYQSVASDANKEAAASQARQQAEQVISGQLDAIAQQAAEAAASQVTGQLPALGGLLSEEQRNTLKSAFVAAGIAQVLQESAAADPTLTVAEAMAKMDTASINQAAEAQVAQLEAALGQGVSQGISDSAVAIANSVASGTARSVASEVASQVSGTVASSVVESVAASAKDQVGTSVAESVKTAAKSAAGTAAIQGAESAKSTIASSINAKGDSGHSLVSGMEALNKAVGQMADKMPTLSGGIDQLYNGSQTLVSNNGTLNDGLNKLVEGKNTMTDGVKKLADGSQELADGMVEFNEEGIEKLVDSYNGDVKSLTDRIRAVADAGSGYESFGGKAEDSVSSVKFIIKTDAVK